LHISFQPIFTFGLFLFCIGVVSFYFKKKLKSDIHLKRKSSDEIMQDNHQPRDDDEKQTEQTLIFDNSASQSNLRGESTNWSDSPVTSRLSMELENKDIQYYKDCWKFQSKIYVIPHPTKVDKGGEDAYFESLDGKAVGVADGVGGWQLHGIDPSVYAKSIMNDAKRAYEEIGLKTPNEMLSFAYENAKHIPGSSTACVLVLDGDRLNTVNLGDSGFMVIRGKKIIYRFKEQHHSFNYPFQLGTASTTTPSDADDVRMEVREGDIIVIGSDGLFDNLFDYEILDIVNAHNNHASNEESLAEILAKTAELRSQSFNVTPFRQTAYALGLVDDPNGGKLDDITVIVSKVIPERGLAPESIQCK
jgi:protein phosphatase PTC7